MLAVRLPCSNFLKKNSKKIIKRQTDNGLQVFINIMKKVLLLFLNC